MLAFKWVLLVFYIGLQVSSAIELEKKQTACSQNRKLQRFALIKLFTYVMVYSSNQSQIGRRYSQNSLAMTLISHISDWTDCTSSCIPLYLYRYIYFWWSPTTFSKYEMEIIILIAHHMQKVNKILENL